jgi:hypothetical protein
MLFELLEVLRLREKSNHPSKPTIYDKFKAHTKKKMAGRRNHINLLTDLAFLNL